MANIEKEQDWYFTSNGNGGMTGWNDPGIATFQKNRVESLVREVIQNSLDARMDKENLPAIIEFQDFKMTVKDFPGYTTYKECLKKCLERSITSQDAKAMEALKKQVTLFAKPDNHIHVLRISDYHTTGLVGAADGNDVDSTWYRLVKGNGVANQDKGAGGSFGIGKSAAFSCSDSRCVFYASLDKHDVASYIGIARLISFKKDDCKSKENPNGWTTGLGIYSDSERKDAILKLPEFEAGFTRKEPGTDIYIMGFPETDDLRDKIVYSVLTNYLVALWSKKLIVKIHCGEWSDKIDSESLERYVNSEVAKRLTDENTTPVKQSAQALQDYFSVLTNEFPDDTKVIPLKAAEYGEKYGFHDGDMILYLMKKEGANRRIMMNREAGMKLFEQKNLNGQIQFTGILIMTGPEMNEAFRSLENPEHNSWIIPDGYKAPRNGRNNKAMYTDLKKYLREQIIKYFQETYSDEIFAFGASDFLPDKPDTSIKGMKAQVKESLRQKTTTISQRKMKAVTAKRSKNAGNDNGLDGDGNDGSKNGGHPRRKKNSGKSNGGTTNPGFDVDASYIPVELPGIRVIGLNKSEGKYRVKFRVPHTSKQVKLSLGIVGEQSSFKIPVKGADIIQGKANIGTCQDNDIILTQVKLGNMITLDVDIDFDQFCLLEVKYSEAK